MGTPRATPLRELFVRLSARQQAVVIAAVVTTAFLSSLDAMVMSTAMPRVVDGLGGSEALYPWVVTAYLLSSTAVLPLYGRYSDLYGRRPAVLIGLVAFLLGSALCALAGSMAQLIAYRTVQGLGAGALLAASMSLIRELFSMEALKKLQMITGSMTATSFIGGPFVGGALTDLLGWRSVFWLNLVIGLPALWILATLLPSYREPDVPRGRQDVAGVLLLIGCITVTLQPGLRPADLEGRLGQAGAGDRRAAARHRSGVVRPRCRRHGAAAALPLHAAARPWHGPVHGRHRSHGAELRAALRHWHRDIEHHAFQGHRQRRGPRRRPEPAGLAAQLRRGRR
ncbi:MFS transporter [Streptomyces sp. NPDC059752]|uniref:MFS transporter n=1 Tax=unclassified Streptomyces TaxID=2593676 RepID=UPI00366001A0